MQDSIPGPRDHALSQEQMLNHRATQVPLEKLPLTVFTALTSFFWVRSSKKYLTGHVVSVIVLVFNAQALFTACKLKVFDVLKDEAPLKAAEVAGRIDASVCGTGRLLDACVALGLLEKTDGGKGTSYVLC